MSRRKLVHAKLSQRPHKLVEDSKGRKYYARAPGNAEEYRMRVGFEVRGKRDWRWRVGADGKRFKLYIRGEKKGQIAA